MSPLLIKYRCRYHMQFEYQAIDASGNIVRGIVKAKEPVKALQILLKEQLHPIDIRPLTDSGAELSRLNILKQRLEGKDVKPKTEEIKPTEPTRPLIQPKKAFDWYYLVFLILMVGIIVLGLLQA